MTNKLRAHGKLLLASYQPKIFWVMWQKPGLNLVDDYKRERITNLNISSACYVAKDNIVVANRLSRYHCH